jgi:hypothetical protein
MLVTTSEYMIKRFNYMVIELFGSGKLCNFTSVQQILVFDLRNFLLRGRYSAVNACDTNIFYCL